MAYNVIDLLNKAIAIASKKKLIYEDIGRKCLDIPAVKVMSKVLAKDVDKNINYYKELVGETENNEFDEIDFSVYDRMSFLINEFARKVYVPEINGVRELLKFSLELERDSHSLLIDLQGRFVRNEQDIYTKTYMVLADIIKDKEKHISMLEKMLKKN
ncbi:MAG: hypothetical protein Q8930_07555 [Bacillota bacterium]|nr:hypothetical protein [Bacillota bacterium]